MASYYNEFDPFAAEWLRGLIAKGLIADGVVDERSITEVQPEDLKGFTQCHFFAGIGGWSYAAQLAGWSDDTPMWSGSPPCQPFSVAGKQKGKDDLRHLWPIFFNLISECKPPVVFGEQVASAIRMGWFDDLQTDLEEEGYASAMVVLGAHSVNAPHKRDRLFYVAERVGDSKYYGSPSSKVGRSATETSNNDTQGANLSSESKGAGRPTQSGDLRHESNPCFYCEYVFNQETLGYFGCPNCFGGVDDPDRDQWVDNTQYEGLEGYSRSVNGERSGTDKDRPDTPSSLSVDWSECYYPRFRDGKCRQVPTEPALFPLAHGIPNRVGTLRGAGNAIVPQVGAEVIKAYMSGNT